MENNSQLYLRVVYDTQNKENGIYVEFDPNDFKQALMNNSKYPHDVAHAFDLTCSQLKKQILKM